MFKVEFHSVPYPKGTSPDGVAIITNLTSGKAAVCRSLRLQEANSIHLAAQRRQQFVTSSFRVFSLGTQDFGLFVLLRKWKSQQNRTEKCKQSWTIPKKFPKNSPKNSQDFENNQFPTSHLEAKILSGLFSNFLFYTNNVPSAKSELDSNSKYFVL